MPDAKTESKASTESQTAPEDETDAKARITALGEALRTALEVIRDYLGYEHDGDPDREDARLMREMEIDDYGRDGRMAAAERTLAGGSPGEPAA